MKICENGKVREMTAEEIAEIKRQATEQERQYWRNISYNKAVNNEIRKKYDISEEFAIIRQKDEKPEEYSEYFNYCEECKTYVKQKMEVASI